MITSKGLTMATKKILGRPKIANPMIFHRTVRMDWSTYMAFAAFKDVEGVTGDAEAIRMILRRFLRQEGLLPTANPATRRNAGDDCDRE